MAHAENAAFLGNRGEEGCDVRVWSGECRHENAYSIGDKYLCTVCGTIAVIDHEVGHAAFCYVRGDYDTLH